MKSEPKIGDLIKVEPCRTWDHQPSTVCPCRFCSHGGNHIGLVTGRVYDFGHRLIVEFYFGSWELSLGECEVVSESR